MKQRSFDLNSGWKIAKDPCDEGRTAGWENAIHNDAVSAYVPSIIQQFFPEYHGLVYYWCSFTPKIDTYEEGRILLRFGGVDYKADVWLNGTYLGSEEGGETPFSFDVTELLVPGKENLLAVRVLNTCDKTIDGLNLMNTPHRNKVIKKRAGSTLNHGGIWYGVTLQAVPRVFIEDVFVNADFNSGKVMLNLAVSSDIQTNATLKIKLSECFGQNLIVAEEESSILVFPQQIQREVILTIENFKAWHVDTPNLYMASVSVWANGEEYTKNIRFGFRDFHVKDGFFYLNGKKLFIKSAHSGNAFPIGQMFPVVPGQLRRDFIYAKSCGFNMLRSIAGLFRPEQLEFADECGILIYEECFASWCLGYSHLHEWADKEEYQNMVSLHPDMPLGDEQAMLDRWRSATEKMILRDRNHPSIVVWGLLNETLKNNVYRTARDFLPRLRELDPTRLVILSSGRWDCDFSTGSASNPYMMNWEYTWGIDGKPDLYSEHIAEGKKRDHITPDNHFYAHFPFQQADKDIYRSYGKNVHPVFLSEFGIGSVFNVIDEVRCFQQYGARADLEDYSWYEEQAAAFEHDFKQLGMDRLFAFPEYVLRASQRNNAFVRREIFDVVRSNPNICGYSLTGLLDHGNCGEGLWSYWRHWKPDMFDSITDGWAPLRFCLFVSHNIYVGEPLTMEAVLANDNILSDGQYTAHFAITKLGIPVHSFSCTFDVNKDCFAVPIMKCTLDFELPAGEYELCAELDGGAAKGNTIPFTIKERLLQSAAGCSVSCLGVEQTALELLKDAGVTVHNFADGDTPEALLVGAGDAETVASAIAAAERGAKVFFLDWRTIDSELAMEQVRKIIPDAELWCPPNWLYHEEIVLNDPDIFDGLGKGLACGRDFTCEWATHTLKTTVTPGYPIAPAFETGSHRAEKSYYLVYAMAGYSYGQGSVYFNTFEIAENIGSPSADRLLINIVKYLNP